MCQPAELQLAGEQRGGGCGGGADEAGLGVVLAAAAALPRHPQLARPAPATPRQARHQALAEPAVSGTGFDTLFMMVSKVDGTFNVIKLLIDIFN